MDIKSRPRSFAKIVQASLAFILKNALKSITQLRITKRIMDVEFAWEMENKYSIYKQYL